MFQLGFEFESKRGTEIKRKEETGRARSNKIEQDRYRGNERKGEGKRLKKKTGVS